MSINNTIGRDHVGRAQRAGWFAESHNQIEYIRNSTDILIDQRGILENLGGLKTKSVLPSEICSLPFPRVLHIKVQQLQTV